MRSHLAWIAAVLLPVFLAASAQAVDDHKAKKYKIEDHKHKIHDIDLSKKEDVAKAADMIAAGQVAHLKEDKPVNPLDFKWDLGLWTIIVFVLLLLILRKAAWGPMLAGLKKREDSIRSAVDEAKLARDETARVRAEFKAEMDKAYAEIPKIMEEARRDAEALKEDLRNQANREIQAERQRFRREIDTAKDQALHEIWDLAVRLATDISSKVMFKALTPDDHNRILHLALEEMKNSGARYREEFLKQN